MNNMGKGAVASDPHLVLAVATELDKFYRRRIGNQKLAYLYFFIICKCETHNFSLFLGRLKSYAIYLLIVFFVQFFCN